MPCVSMFNILFYHKMIPNYLEIEDLINNCLILKHEKL